MSKTYKERYNNLIAQLELARSNAITNKRNIWNKIQATKDDAPEERRWLEEEYIMNYHVELMATRLLKDNQ